LGPAPLAAAGALAAAAILVLAVRGIEEPAPPTTSATGTREAELPSEPAPDLRQLSAIEPPRFTPPRLRSVEGEARRVFVEAMRSYERGDYAAAVPGLEAAVRADPAYPAAHFFLGVCSLQLDQPADAMRHLRDVVRLGESPYLEDAHFFLAKAQIRGGDVEAARGELRTVVALEGDRRAEASRLLAELP
jgi:TolA-binding protein